MYVCSVVYVYVTKRFNRNLQVEGTGLNIYVAEKSLINI